MFETFGDYIINNTLYIDSSTYFTNVIGQITLYEIVLAFYQFLASYNSGDTYLGVNLVEYYIGKDMHIFNKFLAKDFFRNLLLLEVLYKPICVIWWKDKSGNLQHFLNFMWYSFVVLYYIAFIFLVFKLAHNTVSLRLFRNDFNTKELAEEVNKKYEKAFLKNFKKKEIIGDFLLAEELELIKLRRGENELKAYHRPFVSLIDTLFYQFIKVRSEDNTFISDSKLINDILNEKYFEMDNDIIKLTYRFQNKLVKLNIEVYAKEKVNIGLDNIYEWKNNIVKMYWMLDQDERKWLINNLASVESDGKEENYIKYKEDCIRFIMQDELSKIIIEEHMEDEFIENFRSILKKEKYQNMLSEIMSTQDIIENKFEIIKIISLLDKVNCKYLFSYMSLYIFEYKTADEVEDINKELLIALWRKIYVKDFGTCDNEKVIEKLAQCNIKHRINESIYAEFWRLIQNPNYADVLNAVEKSDSFNISFMFWFKMCIIQEKYLICKGKIAPLVMVKLINFIGTHKELMNNEQIQSFIWTIRGDIEENWREIPDKLHISLATLLICDFKIEAIGAYISKKEIYNSCIGEYLLLNIKELPSDIIKQNKEQIRNAFILRKMDIESYIDLLETECNTFEYKINYYQKREMKSFLQGVS